MSKLVYNKTKGIDGDFYLLYELKGSELIKVGSINTLEVVERICEALQPYKEVEVPRADVYPLEGKEDSGVAKAFTHANTSKKEKPVAKKKKKMSSPKETVVESNSELPRCEALQEDFIRWGVQNYRLSIRMKEESIGVDVANFSFRNSDLNTLNGLEVYDPTDSAWENIVENSYLEEYYDFDKEHWYNIRTGEKHE